MTLFSRIPAITQSKSLPMLSEADVDYFVNYEPSSYDHWIFNKGGASGLTGVNAAKALTLQSTAPTYASNYLSLPIYPNGKALLSDYADTETAKDTVCMVVRDPEAGIGVHMLWGNYAGASVGGGTFLSGISPSRSLYLSYAGVAATVNTGLTVPTNTDFYFIAVSRDFSGASKSLKAIVGGQSVFSSEYSGTYNPGSAQTIDVGSPNYTPSNINSATNDIAEFIIFPKALTAAELQAVYLRRKAKLAALGITVV